MLQQQSEAGIDAECWYQCCSHQWCSKFCTSTNTSHPKSFVLLLLSFHSDLLQTTVFLWLLRFLSNVFSSHGFWVHCSAISALWPDFHKAACNLIVFSFRDKVITCLSQALPGAMTQRCWESWVPGTSLAAANTCSHSQGGWIASSHENKARAHRKRKQGNASPISTGTRENYRAGQILAGLHKATAGDF